MATKQADTALHIALTEAPDAAQGVSLVAKAQGIIIRDKASHEACREFLKGAKALKRSIEDHYAKIKKPLNEARNTVLDMEKRHLAPVLSAIATAEKFDTEYVREQKRIEEETARLERERLEREEQARREKEAAEAEKAALKLEAASEALSEREQKFVAIMASQPAAMDVSARMGQVLDAARRAGYKNPDMMVSRLGESKKINDAIVNAIKAARIRAEAELAAAKPILVDVPKVESQIGAVAGTRITTTYRVGTFDVKTVLLKLANEYGTNLALTMEINKYLVDSTDDDERPSALRSLLNSQARQAKDLFERAWPTCKLDKRQGVAG